MRRSSCSGCRPSIETTRLRWGSSLQAAGKARKALTDEGVSPDDGEVDGFFPFDHLEYTADEVVSLKVRELAEIGAAGAKVLRLIGVTAGAAERALAGDLDRKAWLTAGENASPRV